MKTLQIITIKGLCALFLGALLVFAGCENNDAEPSEPMPPTLNLQTLEAETEFGTFEAKWVDSSYVGSMGEGRAIGIAFLDHVTTENRDPEQIVVYIYDRGDLAVLIGEVDSDGVGTLEHEDLSDFEATVELEMDDKAVSGTATFLEEQSTPFTADAASGISGVYWADGTDEDPDVRGDWMVLPDESQWGCVCFPPYRGPCCEMRTN